MRWLKLYHWPTFSNWKIKSEGWEARRYRWQAEIQPSRENKRDLQALAQKQGQCSFFLFQHLFPTPPPPFPLPHNVPWLFPFTPAVSTQEWKQKTDLLIQFQTGRDFKQISRVALGYPPLSVAHLKGEAQIPAKGLGLLSSLEFPGSGTPKYHHCLWAPAAVPPCQGTHRFFIPFFFSTYQAVTKLNFFGTIHKIQHFPCCCNSRKAVLKPCSSVPLCRAWWFGTNSLLPSSITNDCWIRSLFCWSEEDTTHHGFAHWIPFDCCINFNLCFSLQKSNAAKLKRQTQPNKR